MSSQDTVQNIEGKRTKDEDEKSNQDTVRNELKENKEHKETDDGVFLENSANFSLLNIPSGKPDKKNPNLRVKQSPQKGGTSFYYSCKISAMTQKSYFSDQQKNERKIISNYRKQLTLLTVEMDFLRDWFDTEGHSPALNAKIKERTKDKKAQIAHLTLLLNVIKRDGRMPTGLDNVNYGPDFYKKAIENCIREFETSKFNNIREFLGRYYHTLNYKLQCNLLADLKVTNFKDAYLKKLKDEYCIDLSSEDTSKDSEEYINIVKFTTTCKILEAFNLKNCDWSPSDPIESLQKLLLVVKRPLVVSGFFGTTFYTTDPKILNDYADLNHYCILGWAPNTRKVLSSKPSEGYVIAVIGVKKNTNTKIDKQGWVYYLDPSDGSDPASSEKRKIYKISYEQFCKFAHDISTAVEFDKNHEIVHHPKVRSYLSV